MKNQSGTIKTNLELDRVVIGGSGGYKRLPGGSDDSSLQTNTQTLHHNIYIINYNNNTIRITTNNITITVTWSATAGSERRKRRMRFEWVLPACH